MLTLIFTESPMLADSNNVAFEVDKTVNVQKGKLNMSAFCQLRNVDCREDLYERMSNVNTYF